MELLQLQYFRALAHSGHLSQTAAQLHITQPSLSQMLKRLENELGTPLFNRVGKRIILNDSGKIFLKYVEETLDALDQGILEVNRNRQQKQKSVSLCVRSASIFLPELVRQIQEADPEILLQISQHPREDKQQNPALLVSSSPICPEKSKVSEILLREEITAAIPKAHPLASASELTWDDLKKEAFLSLSAESDLAQTVRYFCEIHGIAMKITTYVDNPAVLRRLLCMNMGIALIPLDTWQDFGEDNIVRRTIKDLPMERYLMLSWEENVCRTPAWLLCKKIIKDFFANYKR